MKRWIRCPWFAVTLVAAAVLAGTSMTLSYSQERLPREKLSDGVADPDIFAGKRPPHAPLAEKVYRERDTLASHDDETREAIEAYRRTDDEAEKDRIAKALPELVGKQFDARQKLRERELKQLEEQLRKLQELHQRRAKQRDQIVEERVRQLLRDADGLGWGADEDQPADFSPKKVSLGGNRKAGAQFGL